MSQTATEQKHVLYECGICDHVHPWDFSGDCRNDANRYGTAEDYEDQHGIPRGSSDLRSMEDRVNADVD